MHAVKNHSAVVLFCVSALAARGQEALRPETIPGPLVEAALNTSTFLAVEAGCGIGKSLAYGIPLFRWCAGSRLSMLATATKSGSRAPSDERTGK